MSESDFCCYYRTPKTGKFVKKIGLFNTQFRRFRNMVRISWWMSSHGEVWARRNNTANEKAKGLRRWFN